MESIFIITTSSGIGHLLLSKTGEDEENVILGVSGQFLNE